VVRRYLPAELVGTGAGLVAGLAFIDLGIVAAAVAASWAESTAFYAFVTVRESRRPDLATRPPLRRTLLALRETATEYGGAELVDTVFLRPLLMYAFIGPLGAIAGILAGKLITDAGFYAFAIAAYSVRGAVRRRSRERAEPLAFDSTG
jgi:hypothetical protein